MPVEVENKIRSMIRGEVKYTSGFLGFNLLMTRLIRKYGADAGCLEECVQEAKVFCKKYEIIMEKEYFLMARA